MTKDSETFPNPKLGRYKIEKRTMVMIPLEEIQQIRDRLGRWRDHHHESRILWSQVHALYERLATQARPKPTVKQVAESN